MKVIKRKSESKKEASKQSDFLSFSAVKGVNGEKALNSKNS